MVNAVPSQMIRQRDQWGGPPMFAIRTPDRQAFQPKKIVKGERNKGFRVLGDSRVVAVSEMCRLTDEPSLLLCNPIDV